MILFVLSWVSQPQIVYVINMLNGDAIQNEYGFFGFT